MVGSTVHNPEGPLVYLESIARHLEGLAWFSDNLNVKCSSFSIDLLRKIERDTGTLLAEFLVRDVWNVSRAIKGLHD